MKLHPLYYFDTRVGRFFISVSDDGRFHPVYEDESLGSYHSALAAADDLAGGHTFSAPGVKDTAALGIPADIGEWEEVGAV
jgi:hypothetical protein